MGWDEARWAAEDEWGRRRPWTALLSGRPGARSSASVTLGRRWYGLLVLWPLLRVVLWLAVLAGVVLGLWVGAKAVVPAAWSWLGGTVGGVGSWLAGLAPAGAPGWLWTAGGLLLVWLVWRWGKRNYLWG